MLFKGGDKPSKVDVSRVNRFGDPDMERFMNPIYGAILCSNGKISNHYYLAKSRYTHDVDPHVLKRVSDTCNSVPGTPIIKPTNDIFKIKPLDIGRYIALKYVQMRGFGLFIRGKQNKLSLNLKKIKPEELELLQDCNNKLNKYIPLLSQEEIVQGNHSVPEQLNLRFFQKKTSRVGERVECNFGGHGKWYPGKIGWDYKDRTYDIYYDDGDSEMRVSEDRIRSLENENEEETKKTKTENMKFDFHMLLYFLWWVADNDDGIDKYYEGVTQVLGIVNTVKNDKKNEGILPTNKPDFILPAIMTDRTHTFEYIVIGLTVFPFHVYTYYRANAFCDNREYPDCGETTVRNLINLFCYTSIAFDTNILTAKGAITELIEYYKVFHNFELQSSLETRNIYGKQLNARDAWSYLIIFYANKNITFHNDCPSSNSYELSSGKSKAKGDDGEYTHNFLQLIRNFFSGSKVPIEYKDLINGGSIQHINMDMFNPETYTGQIKIYNSTDTYEIGFNTSHYYMKRVTINTKIAENTDIDEEKKKYIQTLKPDEPNEENIYDLNMSSETLFDHLNAELRNNTETDIEYFEARYAEAFQREEPIEYTVTVKMYIKLFMLSITDKYDSILRGQVVLGKKKRDHTKYTINPSSYILIFNTICMMSGNDTKMNEYVYSINTDFEFVKQIPALRHLSCDTYGARYITTIDLSPLTQMTSIGDNFLKERSKLKEINLEPLANVTSIGSDFLLGCGLKVIDLRPLVSLTSIGNNFLSYIRDLNNVDLSPLIRLTSIPNGFLEMNYLTTIDLTPLQNVVSIGDDFLKDSRKLKEIDLTPLHNVKSIGSDFLAECRMETIDLTPLQNVESIGSGFLRQNSFTEITPPSIIMPNLTKIENEFMDSVYSKTTIELILPNVVEIEGEFLKYGTLNIKLIAPKLEIIGGDFMARTPNDIFQNNSPNLQLQHIDLTGISSVKKIGRGFLMNNRLLETVDLPVFGRLVSIEYSFMSGCTKLESIVLRMPKLKTIGKDFMTGCYGLKNIDLSSLTSLTKSSLTKVGENFLTNNQNLKIIQPAKQFDAKEITNLIMTANKASYDIRLKEFTTAYQYILEANFDNFISSTEPRIWHEFFTNINNFAKKIISSQHFMNDPNYQNALNVINPAVAKLEAMMVSNPIQGGRRTRKNRGSNRKREYKKTKNTRKQ